MPVNHTWTGSEDVLWSIVLIIVLNAQLSPLFYQKVGTVNFFFYVFSLLQRNALRKS